MRFQFTRFNMEKSDMLPKKMLTLVPMAIALSACSSIPLIGGGAKSASSPAIPDAPVVVSAIAPADIAVPENQLALDLSSGGRVVVQLRPDVAPNHVARIKELTRAGFYNGVVFHRVIDGFMAQGGDPTGTGQGGSQLPDLKAEFNGLPHVRGTLSMARAQSDDSANSQFFIMLQPNLRLDRSYTAFGRVISGMQFVDMIRKGEPPVSPSRVVQASIVADNKPVPPVLTEAPLPAAQPISTDLNAPIGN